MAAGRTWGSPGETRAIRQWLSRREKQNGNDVDYRALADKARKSIVNRADVDGDPAPAGNASPRDGIRHYPTLGMAAMQAKEAKLYRDWLVARFLDPHGSGWCDERELKQALTDESSPLRCFTPRQWREHRRLGEGRYWTLEAARDGSTRLRYTSAGELAKRLDSGPISGDPVIIPVDVLGSSLGTFKAHLTASFHAGRQDEEGEGAPISRGAMSAMTGVSVRTLQRYDKRAGVEATANYEIGEKWTVGNAQEAAWEAGTAVFKFVDHKGKHGQPRQEYIARQLPNSYVVGGLDTAPRGRQRKINRYLRNACDHGAQANGEGPERIFHKTAKELIGSLRRRKSDRPTYWRSGQTRSGAGVWHRMRHGQ